MLFLSCLSSLNLLCYTFLRTKNTKFWWTPPYKRVNLVYYSEEWRALEGLDIPRNKAVCGLMWFPLSVIMTKTASNPPCLKPIPAPTLQKNCQSVHWHNGRVQLVGLPRLATSACSPSAPVGIPLPLTRLSASWLALALSTKATSNALQFSAPWP